MVQQELATIVSREEEEEASEEAFDIECPDCDSLLTISYNEEGRARYFCENCSDEFAAPDISSDNNISTISYRGLF